MSTTIPNDQLRAMARDAGLPVKWWDKEPAREWRELSLFAKLAIEYAAKVSAAEAPATPDEQIAQDCETISRIVRHAATWGNDEKAAYVQWPERIPKGVAISWADAMLAAAERLRNEQAGGEVVAWTDADSDAARLALELECLLLDTKDTASVSRWWASALEALELHRKRLAATPQPEPEPKAVSGAGMLGSLLRKPVASIAELSKTIPGGCYCPPGICQAPVIMGRQTPCLRHSNEHAPEPKAEPVTCTTCEALARAVILDQSSFDQKPCAYAIRRVGASEMDEEWEDIRTSPDRAREEANDMMATGRGEIYEVVPVYAQPFYLPPQAEPVRVPEDVMRDAERYRVVRRGQHWSVVNGIGDTLRGEALDAAVDAIAAAQAKGGK